MISRNRAGDYLKSFYYNNILHNVTGGTDNSRKKVLHIGFFLHSGSWYWK